MPNRRRRQLKRRSRKRPLTLVTALLVLFALFVWWPVDAYGEGPLWDLKATVDSSIRSPIENEISKRRVQSGEWQTERAEEARQDHQRFIATLEERVIAFTNEERERFSLRQLKHDAEISSIARKHSENMMREGVFEHDLYGKDPTDRALAAGYDCEAHMGGGRYFYGLSENIFYIERPYGSAEQIAREIVQGWMDSPGHREIILDRDSRRIGVGVVKESGELYATQNFSPCH